MKFLCFEGSIPVSPVLMPFSMAALVSYDAPVPDVAQAGPGRGGRFQRIPPQSFFLVSAIFHYLGPSLAVLLFARVSVLGVAWLRIASAAAVFALWRRPPWQIGRAHV